MNQQENKRHLQKAQTRQAILEAAEQCFAHFGYDGTNYREISRRCGAERSLILYHFKNKESLWKAAVESIEQRFNEYFDAHYRDPAPQTPDRERVAGLMSAFIDALVEVPEYSRILLREGSSEGPRMEWLAHHFAPPRAMRVELSDREVVRRVQKTVVRDILASVMVSFVGLGPLMERSLAVATGSTEAGIHPLRAQTKQALIDYLVAMVFKDRPSP